MIDKDKHHIFTYYEVRKKIIEIYGEPKTDEEHWNIGKMSKRIHKRIPTIEICKELHRNLHLKKDL